MLGAALAARVVERDVERGPACGTAGVARLAPAADLPRDQRHGQDQGDQGEGEKGGQHRRAGQPPEARGKKMTRSASVGMSAYSFTISASRRPLPGRVVGTAA